MPRYDQHFTGHCEQNIQETLQLKQRFLDAKSKRVPKSKDKKQQESIQSSVHVVQQKFLKRSAEEHESGGSGASAGDSFEPPVKLQCTAQQHGSHPNEGLTKFSVEIVQQLEFTTSAASSQPQQISTNVTVKAHTNASVKSDVSSPKSNPATPASNVNLQKSNIGLETLVECVKQEPDNDFADLDQCAAALEKDAAANGGTGFGGFSDLIGEDTNDDIIPQDAFNDLLSDITNYPGIFDFDDKSELSVSAGGLKVEDLKDLPQQAPDAPKATHSPHVPPNNYSPPVFDGQPPGSGLPKGRMAPYASNMDFCKTELSPAAQTLKQMAEQHQHKNQMGMSFNPNTRAPNARSPYPDFPFQGDYGSPNSNPAGFHKSPSFSQPDMIKQEMIFQGNEFDMGKRKGAGMYKQPYSPYSSPSASSHGSPGYLPRSGTGSAGGPQGGAFGGGTPPRPPSGPGGGNNSGPTLQINQAQQLHISQQNHGHAIQVSAGQHLHLSGELKGNVSIAAQQGMHFTQHVSSNGAPSQAQPQQNAPQQNPLSGHQQQHQQAPQMHPNGQQGQGPQMMGGNQQQMPNAQGMGNMMGGHPGGMGQMGDGGYSMSQSQTINFTQQTLRQRATAPNVVPNNMGPSGPMGPGPMGNQGGMGPRLINTQSLEQQKLIQQQMMRAQQAAGQQQHIVRPPPPEYKANAGMMQGMPRFAAGPPNIRRMPHQAMPPSGPMMRPHNMYMIQQQQQQQQQQQPQHQQQQQHQQHMIPRNMYPRQQGPMGGMEAMQQTNPEWRHLLMQQQQQNPNYNPQMRSNMQPGFNMIAGNMPLSAMQHQQIRTQQQGMGNMGGQQGMVQSQVMGQGNNPMAQMNNMNQMITHMQQQQSMMQQQNSQMSISSIHMQQNQSMTVSNQALQQQQQQNMNNHQLVNNNTNNQNSALGNFNPQSTDFSLEFLDNLPTGDSTAFDQELLNSFDSDSGFNLDF